MAGQNLKQVAYKTIKDNIINCKYEPASLLNEDVICKDLEMSRTPVRDALGRLEMEGLVKILPKKGFMITQLSVQDINAVYECRILIEPYIIRNYCQHLSVDILEKLKECIQNEKESMEQDKRDFYVWDNEFHQLLQKQCENAYIRKTLDDVHSQNSRIRALAGKKKVERHYKTIEEHEKILTELMRDQAETAAEVMREHLLIAKTEFFENFTGLAGMPLNLR